jgi:hypothetical protein
MPPPFSVFHTPCPWSYGNVFGASGRRHPYPFNTLAVLSRWPFVAASAFPKTPPTAFPRSVIFLAPIGRPLAQNDTPIMTPARIEITRPVTQRFRTPKPRIAHTGRTSTTTTQFCPVTFGTWSCCCGSYLFLRTACYGHLAHTSPKKWLQRNPCLRLSRLLVYLSCWMARSIASARTSVVFSHHTFHSHRRSESVI